MKTMAYWVGLILVGSSGGRPDAGLVITVVIMFVVSFLIVIFFYVSSTRTRVYMICLIIGCRIAIHGFSEIYSGRWTGVIFVLLGPVIPYLGYRSRERIDQMMKKWAEEDQRSKVGKPEFCARCAKKMGEDPKVQSDRIMLYISEDDVEEYVCPICGDVIKKAILMEPAKLHRYLQEQDLEDIEHEPRFRPIS